MKEGTELEGSDLAWLEDYLIPIRESLETLTTIAEELRTKAGLMFREMDRMILSASPEELETIITLMENRINFIKSHLLISSETKVQRFIDIMEITKMIDHAVAKREAQKPKDIKTENIAHDPKPSGRRPKEPQSSHSSEPLYMRVGKLVQEGKSVEEIAQTLGKSPQQIYLLRNYFTHKEGAPQC